jgi:outer membrane immunogenic protein
MKRVLLGSAVASILAVTSASAADMAARPYTKAPVIAATVYGWTGGYIGLNVGYSWGKADTVLLPTSIFATPISAKMNGVLGGAQAGYNWQVDRSWVLGIEGDIQGTDEKADARAQLASLRTTLPGGDFNLVTTTSHASSWNLPWFATLRGRVGVLADPTWLFYGTGGLAIGEVKFATQLTGTFQQFGPGPTGTIPNGAATTVLGPALSESQTRVGWALGAGTEKKFGQNWSAKLEYLYVDLGKKSYFSSAGTPLDLKFRDQIVRVGINYAFSPMAVVAKY